MKTPMRKRSGKKFKKIMSLVTTLLLIVSAVGGFVVLAEPVTYQHSGSFNDSDKQNPVAGAFSYNGAVDGVFTPLDTYKSDWGSWVKGGASPIIGSYFVGGSSSGDGAITWTAPESGSVTVTSNLALKKENGADLQFMITQERGGEFAPLWPMAGKFAWQEVTSATNVTPSFTTTVEAGDKIHFMTRCATDGVAIFNPTLTLTPGVAESMTFWRWGEPVDKIYSHSGSFNDSDKQSPVAGAFSYNGAVNGVFTPLDTYKSDWGSWIKGGTSPIVGSCFVGGSDNGDGSITWTTPESGSVSVASTLPLKKQGGADSQLMIVQERSGKFAPLWPEAGKFTWQEIMDATNLTLPALTTSVEAGDKIHFMARCATDGVAEIDPKLVLSPGAATSVTFIDWDDGAEPPPATLEFQHSGSFNDSDKQSPIGGSFRYNRAVGGVFAPLDTYVGDWAAWTKGGESPIVGSYFVGGSGSGDGSITWIAPESGSASIASTLPLKKNNGANLQFMIVQERSGKFAPLWPEAGKFTWQEITGATNLTLPVLTASVEAGDKIHFVARCATDGVAEIDPKLVLSPGAATSVTFIDWDDGAEPPPAILEFQHSGSFNDSDRQSPIGGSFRYNRAVGGVFTPLDTYVDNWSAWTKDGASPIVGSYFVGGSDKGDGSITWTSPESGSLSISSGLPIKKNNGGATRLMIVQERSGKFMPLWPETGKFIWKEVDTASFTLPTITTTVQKGDKIHFMARCAIDGVVEIDPKLALSPGAAGNLTFVNWENKEGSLSPSTGDDNAVGSALWLAGSSLAMMVFGVRGTKKSRKTRSLKNAIR